MNDETLLRRAIAIAAESRAAGNHPFGALLAGPDGQVLLEQFNGQQTGDRTAHAERALMSRASQLYDADFLARCALVTSAEPCAMCTGAAYWAGIGKIVFGLSEHDLKAMIGPHPENLTMDLPCRTVVAAGQREIAVVGPLLEAESAIVHEGFW